MKKIFIYSLILISLFEVSSCGKLDLAPEDYYASGNFWKNAAQVDGAMTGLHAQLRDYQFTFYIFGEMRGGLLKTGTGATGTSSLNSGSYITQDLRESNPGVSSWGQLYRALVQVNNFIYQVENNASFLLDAQKSYYLGQAYGLRAFYYFQLARAYGRVPLVIQPTVVVNTPKSQTEAFVPRSKTEKETFDLIKSDIDKSITNFNGDYTTKANKGQWSLAATQMLKTEVYLWTAKVNMDNAAPANTVADLATARSAVEDVIPRYSLQPSFADVFNYNKKGNSEIIFALRYLQGEATNNFGQFLYAQADAMGSFVDKNGVAFSGDPLNIAGGGSILRYEYTYNLYKQYASGDQRADLTFFPIYKKPVSNANGYILMKKFIGTVVNNNRSFSDDVPVYRLAEAYLLLAEIKNKQGQDPGNEVNIVRKRAFGGAIPAGQEFVNGTFEQNELAIFWERTKELVGEGKRWYDLRRMQDANGKPLAFRTDLPLVGVLNEATEKHKLLLPIDRSTLNQDETLEQNPGYPGT
ncbi:RagB/SusD family nutrient uptake outer membrane protein [Haoranjiania flava]|uniref:RagB/SusD family nutrient uptake outer membrane protein n=1 Tax=Haoranjiania flava TaxID=1856322 RepID=A0AAE3IP75_9BACT|nr:RagB/SusD family nutrient uptake outer membrane protein [Haoranjiania flava]MCU7694775.1 RagB/SusD family nutrient uptake outer membrane protein [Haoranjiania flava]